MKRFIPSLLLVLSITSALASADKLSHEEFDSFVGFLGFYRFVSMKDAPAWHDEVCPPLIGVVGYKGNTEGYYSLKVKAFDEKTRKDKSFYDRGIWDPEQPYQFYNWYFVDVNGPAKKWRTWNEISDGFSKPTADLLFRNQKVTLSSSFKQIDDKTARLVQTETFTPYTLGFVRHGKVETMSNYLYKTETADGTILTLIKDVNGQTKRTCTYKAEPKS